MSDFVTALVLTFVSMAVMLAPAILADWVSYAAGMTLFGVYFVLFIAWVARWR
jgi:hypothetical protein